jgi:hypothetical protein
MRCSIRVDSIDIQLIAQKGKKKAVPQRRDGWSVFPKKLRPGFTSGQILCRRWLNRRIQRRLRRRTRW